jgi:catechol 2,3-dioxygenase-like lactoylglutathione lyase family enzyme
VAAQGHFRVKSWLWALLCLSTVVQAAPGSPLVGIDHMPLAVRNLEQATDDYRRLGFAIKPGRLHANGIRNNNVKFPDGAGIELITAPEARDALSSSYVALLKQGEGPAYLGFHARDFERFVATLDAAGIGHTTVDGLMTLTDPSLGFLFFLKDNRAPNDRPEHFAHPNGARAVRGVWLAMGDPAPLVRVFTALGAAVHKQKVLAPEPIDATVLDIDQGRIVLLPASRQITPGRPIVGEEYRVSTQEGGKDVFFPPAQTHNIWLHLIAR